MLKQHVCISCKLEFIGGPRASYCPSCREIRYKEAKALYQRRKNAGLSRDIGSEDRCEVCGKFYIVMSGQQKYCKDCAEKMIKEKSNELSLAWYHKNKKRINTSRHFSRMKGPKICPVCGKEFKKITCDVCCSNECKKIRIREMMKIAEEKRRFKKTENHVVQ